MRTPGPAPAHGPLLAVIDMQNVFADPESYWSTPRFAEILPRVRQLIDRYLPRVVLTRFVAPARPEGAWVDYYADWPGALTAPDHPQYDLVGALSGLELPVITRTTFGKWDAELSERCGADPELVLAGVSTDCCVISTALAAADGGARVRVVADACAGASDVDHRRALDAMALYTPLITITDTATMLEGGETDLR